MTALVRGVCGGSVVHKVVVVVLLDLFWLDNGYLLPGVRDARPASSCAGSCDEALAFGDRMLMIYLLLAIVHSTC